MTRKPARKAQSTRDNFESATARLGLGQDNMLARSGYVPGRNISRNPAELEDMYRTSWVVGRMVEVVAEDMVRGGVAIQAQMDPGDVDRLLTAMTRSGVPGRLADAIKWARLYGGALAVPLIDGHDLAAPLDLEQVEKDSFRGLYILDRHQVTPSQETIKDLGPMLGYPESYVINEGGLDGQRIHHTRAIRFVGIELPRRQRLAEQHWGASVVERAFDRILALDSSTYGAANLMLKASRLHTEDLLGVLVSLYGPHAFDLARRLDHGLRVPQNRDFLRRQGLALVTVGTTTSAADLVGGSWLPRVDVTLTIRQGTPGGAGDVAVLPLQSAPTAITGDTPHE